MNIGYKLVLSEIARPVIEKTSSGLVTVAQTQHVNLPMNCSFPKSVTITVGGRTTPVIEVEDQGTWDALNTYVQYSDMVERFFVRNNFGVGHSQLLLYPIPSSASLPVNVVYEVIDKDLSVDVFNTGNITLTNGDETIAHSATGFTAAMVGRYVKAPDGFFYRIASFTSTASMELENKYEGATVTTASLIHEMFGLPEEMQILPIYYAMAFYFAMKKDTTQETKYWTLFTAGIEAGKRRWGTKTRSNISRSGVSYHTFPMAAPGWFPSSAT